MSLGLVLPVFAIGGLVGLIGALFGVGGGVLIVPVLVVGFGVPIHAAVGTSLLCVVATSSAASSRNIRTGIANVRLATALEPCTVIGAIVGALIAGILPGPTLMRVFGATVIAMAIPMARGVPDEDDSEPDVPPVDDDGLRLAGRYVDPAIGEVVYRVERMPVLMGVSVVAGVISGLLGVGGGILQVPVMTMLGNVPMKAAAATSNMMIGVTAVASAMLYYGRGDLAPAIVAASVTGVLLGSRTGVIVGGRVHGEKLRRAFAGLMVLIGIQLLLKAYGLWFR